MVGQYGQRNNHLLGRDVCFHTQCPLWQTQFERASQGLDRTVKKPRQAVMLKSQGGSAKNDQNVTNVHVMFLQPFCGKDFLKSEDGATSQFQCTVIHCKRKCTHCPALANTYVLSMLSYLIEETYFHC